MRRNPVSSMFSAIALPVLTGAILSASPSFAAITFSRDVAPILQRHCEECHRPGQVAPMTFLTFEEVRPWAKAIQNQVATRRMPPFHADGSIGRYEDDPRLAQTEIDTIVAWVNQGAVEGDREDLPPPRSWSVGWVNGNPDLVIALPKPHRVHSSEEDEYVFTVLEHVFSEDTWVRGIEIKPGNPDAVHHANLCYVPDGAKPNDEGVIEGLRVDASMEIIAGWLPGSKPMVLPEGKGMRIDQGRHLALEIHYSPTAEDQVDRTSVGILFADGRLDRMQHGILAFYGGDTPIPPGVSDHRLVANVEFPEDAMVTAFQPHMHLRGKSYTIRFHYPDGRVETVFDVPRYDFNWQRRYVLTEPIRVPKGTIAENIAVFDNSEANPYNPDPAAEVRWGWNTDDEMMVGGINYELAHPEMDIVVERGRMVSGTLPSKPPNAVLVWALGLGIACIVLAASLFALRRTREPSLGAS